MGLRMIDAPHFFLPASTPETIERDFASLARIAQRPVPELSERIYSIKYRHNGEEWCATVGSTLSGYRARTIKSGGRTIEQRQPLSDPAVVLAIFPGAPYIVVTNHRLTGGV